MKKRICAVLLALAMVLSFAACGEETPASVTSISIDEPDITSVVPEIVEPEPEPEPEPEEPEVIEIPEGMYRSELTNEPISEELKDQRPIAVMVDNEIKAYPHIGLNNADVVYENRMNFADGDRVFAAIKRDLVIGL